MIVGTIRILADPPRRAEVLEIFRSISGPVRAQPGCSACHVYEEQDPDSSVVLVETWDDEAAFEEHLRSETYRRILGAIELSARPPEIRFDTVSTTEGMELIERLRHPPGRGTTPVHPGDGTATGG